VPKTEWARSTYLLRNTQLRPEKIEIQLIGLPSLQIKCNLETVTAGLLREKVLKLEGLTNSNANRIFALWIVSDRLSLQLNADKNVKMHLDKWSHYLEKWGDDSVFHISNKQTNDLPRLVVKRDARTLLGDEEQFVSILFKKKSLI
jgi:hypothetical protein